MEHWIETALSMGFTYAAPANVSTLVPRPAVRTMCAEDKCRAYGKNWMCPPHCGTLEQCAGQIETHEKALLVQYVGHAQKAIDTRAYRQTEETFLRLFSDLAEKVRKVHPEALCLGAGGCRVCKECAFPDACRAPEKALSSMEGYGLFVTEVCRSNGLGYHYGEGSICYTGCILI